MNATAPRSYFSKAWLVVGISALLLSAVVQRYVEKRRVQANLTWSEPDKDVLEVGFLTLGGFRGILADMLWIRAQAHQNSSRYYELKLLCDLILKLQPTFTQVHAFQAYNMSYNLALKAEGCDDKWYWMRSGLTTLEKGLERNQRNYLLWFELGYQYFDRLGDIKLGHCLPLRTRELPNIDELSEPERMAVFLDPKWMERRGQMKPARNDEHLRWASYFFWKAMETQTDPTPLRTERMYGQCIERLGHWWPSSKPKGERVHWDDWGAEDWWVEVRDRNRKRGLSHDDSVPTNLKFCIYQQMDYFEEESDRKRAQGDLVAAKAMHDTAVAAYERFRVFFSEERKSMPELLQMYRSYRDRPAGPKAKAAAPR